MKVLCYIQARAGRKRIPNKNLYVWDGKTFLEGAIKKAFLSELFDIVIVTSDSVEILDMARDYGCVPVLRSYKASSDFATDNEVAIETVRPFVKYDYACKLYPCVPLLKAADIHKAFRDFISSGADALRTVDENHDDAGAFWFFDIKKAIGAGTLDTLVTKDYKLDNCQDINTYEDIKRAREKSK